MSDPAECAQEGKDTGPFREDIGLWLECDSHLYAWPYRDISRKALRHHMSKFWPLGSEAASGQHIQDSLSSQRQGLTPRRTGNPLAAHCSLCQAVFSVSSAGLPAFWLQLI